MGVHVPPLPCTFCVHCWGHMMGRAYTGPVHNGLGENALVRFKDPYALVPLMH